MPDDRTLGWEEPAEEEQRPSRTAESASRTRPDVTQDVPSDARPTAMDPGDVQARVAAQVAAVAAAGTGDATDPMIGRLIHGRFLIESRIGAGGMGIVYRAYQTGIQRPVAVKMLLRELAGEEKVVKRFQIEALAVSRLNHPNTIRIYDFGQTEDGALYFAMEYLEGRSLEQAIRREGALSVRRALHIMRQIAASLTEAHEKGIIHRDLKPDNVFLIRVGDDPDFVKVLDFGVAKLREADQRQGTVTQAGTIFGTPRYMAPEQCRSMAVDHRADLYAIGVIGYEMMAGRPPFDAENPLAILIQHVQESPPPLAEVRPDLEVPDEVEDLVMRCLAKDPEKRFQTAADLVAEIARCEASLAGRFREVVRIEGVRPPPRKRDLRDEETVIGPVEVSSARRSRRGRLGMVLGLSGALVAGGLAFGWWWSRPADQAPLLSPTEGTPTPAPTPSPPAPEAPATPASVRIRLASVPEDAEVLLGDRVLGKTPGEVEIPFSREALQLTFRKSGFLDAQVSLVPDRDGALSANLAPRGGRPAPVSGPRAREDRGNLRETTPGDRPPASGETPPAKGGEGPGKVRELKTF